MIGRRETRAVSAARRSDRLGILAASTALAAAASVLLGAAPATSRPATTRAASSQPATTQVAAKPASKPTTRKVVHKPAPVRVTPQVKELVDQLAADNWAVRERAAAALAALGEDILPQLATALSTAADPEVRARLETVTARIEDLRLVGTSYVTLHLDKVPASEAFAQLARQARATLPTEPPNLLSGKADRRVSLKVTRRPFWEVMELLCKQADVEPATLTRHNREAGLGLTRAGANLEPGENSPRRGWADRPVVHGGPLLIRAESLTHSSSISLRDPNDNTNEFALSLGVLAEPKLRVLDYSGTATLLEAVDDLGNSLLPPDDNGVPANVETYGNVHGGAPAQWSVGATLAFPKQNPGKRIARLRGTVGLEVQIRSAKLDVPVHSAKGVSLDLDGVRVRIKSADGARAEVTIFRDGRSDADWYHLRTLLTTGEAQLVSDKGQVTARSQLGIEMDESDDGQRVDMRLRFSRDGEDDAEVPRLRRRERDRQVNRQAPEGTRLVWEIPVETREVVVPFMFRDLPMPR